LDFHIGHDALANSATYSVSYPVRHGMVGLVLSNSLCLQGLSVIGRFLPSFCMQVENWDYMERFYQQCIFKYVLAHCLCLLRSRLRKIITHSAT
jgi:actin-related protein 3